MSRNKTISKLIKLKDNKKMEMEIVVKRAADRADEEKTRLNSLEQNYSDTLNKFAEVQVDNELKAGNITAYYEFFGRIEGRIKDQEKAHDRCQDDLENCKDKLVNAHKEKKAVEMLHDRQIQKETRERNRSEQKDADFFTLARRIK